MRDKLKMLAQRFGKLTLSQRVLICVSLAIAITVVVFAALQIAGVFDYAACVYLPLMSVSLCLQAYTQKSDRKMVTLSLVCAAVVFLCAVGVILITILA